MDKFKKTLVREEFEMSPPKEFVEFLLSRKEIHGNLLCSLLLKRLTELWIF